MIALVLLPEMPGMIEVSPMMGTALNSSQPSAGKSTSADTRSRQPFSPTGIYNSVYS